MLLPFVSLNATQQIKRLVQQILILLSPFTKHVYDLRFKCHIILHLYKGAIVTELIIGIILKISSMNFFFLSSGPKPCEACRQEEIYEEPISILNSNEVIMRF